MSKRIMIGLFALSVVAVLRTEASAGCAVIAGFQVCASWITGGSEVGQISAQGFNQVAPACPTVVAEQGSGSGSSEAPAFSTAAIAQPEAGPVTLKLAGTVGDHCGLDSPNDQCNIRGVAFCGASDPPIALTLPLAALTTATTFGWPDHVDEDDDRDHPRARRVTTIGPLTVRSPDGLGQVDFSSQRNFAGFRFQINGADKFPNEQAKLCPGREFITFIAREGFFEARASIASGDNAGRDVCVRERCTVDLNGIGPDVPRVYRCQPLPPGPNCLQ